MFFFPPVFLSSFSCPQCSYQVFRVPSALIKFFLFPVLISSFSCLLYSYQVFLVFCALIKISLFLNLSRDVGFSGKTPAVIRHALRLLADDVTVTESQKDPEGAVEVHIEPKLGLPHVLNLTFYSNQVKDCFMDLVILDIKI